MPLVTIVQRVLPHYRHAFFERLHGALADSGVELNLIYGQEKPGSVPKTLELDRPWAKRIRNKYVSAKGVELVWQPCLDQFDRSHLVIVEQANRLLVNYWLALRSHSRGQKIAFWGHGRNMQASSVGSWRERFKSNFVGAADWWFAYTELSSNIVGASGFSSDRITVVQNAIDTDELAGAVESVLPDQLQRIKDELNIHSDNICVYCGGMYRDKKLAFLLASCLEIKSSIPDFHMLFIGDGPDRRLVEQAAFEHSWIHNLGPKYGADRVPYFVLSKALLISGGIGLGIVDSFVTRTPLITTDVPLHGPEIAYLTNHVNGVITAHVTRNYADAVVEYLHAPSRQSTMRDACALSARKYTLENMVRNFAAGVLQCLESPRSAKKGMLSWRH